MTHDTINALIIEDEPIARTLLAKYLRTQGWHILELSNGANIIECVTENQIDIIFLDLRLPGIDGQTLCKELRQHANFGVIFTTSCDDPIEKIIAMENGADAYYVKPLPLREILAYAKNLIKRVRSELAPAPSKEHYIRFNDWEFSSKELVIKDNSNNRISLTRNETRVLGFMIKNANQPLGRDELGHLLGRTEWHPDDRGIDVLISKLRSKLTKISGKNQLIKTQYGVGYMFSGNGE